MIHTIRRPLLSRGDNVREATIRSRSRTSPHSTTVPFPTDSTPFNWGPERYPLPSTTRWRPSLSGISESCIAKLELMVIRDPESFSWCLWSACCLCVCGPAFQYTVIAAPVDVGFWRVWGWGLAIFLLQDEVVGWGVLDFGC